MEWNTRSSWEIRRKKAISLDRLFILLLPNHQGGQHDLSSLAIQLPLGYSSEVLGIVGIALPSPILGHLIPSAFVFIRCSVIHVGIEATCILQCTHGLLEVCILDQLQVKEPRLGLGVHHGLLHFRFLSRDYGRLRPAGIDNPSPPVCPSAS